MYFRSPARDLNPDLCLRRAPFYPVELTGLVLPARVEQAICGSKPHVMSISPGEHYR